MKLVCFCWRIFFIDTFHSKAPFKYCRRCWLLTFFCKLPPQGFYLEAPGYHEKYCNNLLIVRFEEVILKGWIICSTFKHESSYGHCKTHENQSTSKTPKATYKCIRPRVHSRSIPKSSVSPVHDKKPSIR